jgi:hypothetical protein
MEGGIFGRVWEDARVLVSRVEERGAISMMEGRAGFRTPRTLEFGFQEYFTQKRAPETRGYPYEGGL